MGNISEKRRKELQQQLKQIKARNETAKLQRQVHFLSQPNGMLTAFSPVTRTLAKKGYTQAQISRMQKQYVDNERLRRQKQTYANKSMNIIWGIDTQEAITPSQKEKLACNIDWNTNSD